MSARLAELQTWFQDQVVARTEGRRPAPEHDARAHLAPSRSLRATERVAIYASMYPLRMQEALQADFPALRAFLGPEAFARLVRGYVRACPSRHYSLNFLGEHLPEYLRGPRRIARRALLADIAEVELAIAQVFDQESAPPLAPEDLRGIAPEELAAARLALVPALRLLALSHRANAIVSALRQEKPLPELGRERTWVAVYRKDWVVWRMDLERPAYETLCALQGGATLAEAVETGARAARGSPEALAADVQRWFAEWAAEGFFAGRGAPRRA